MIVAAVVMAIGAAVSAYGSYQAGQAQKAAADYNSKVIKAEAIQKEMELREDARRARRSGKEFMSAQRQALASSGVVTSMGSPLESLGKTAGQIELQAQDAARQGRSVKDFGFSKAAAVKQEGKLMANAATIGAVGSGLSGIGSATAMGAGAFK